VKEEEKAKWVKKETRKRDRNKERGESERQRQRARETESPCLDVRVQRELKFIWQDSLSEVFAEDAQSLGFGVA
jgi:hypothetical protein